MSNAEQAFNAECKCLLLLNDADSIEQHLPVLADRIVRYPQYKYLPYYKARLLFAIEKQEEAIASLMPFVQNEESAFWVWQLLAQIYTDTEHKQMYYCKALLCKSPQEMTIRLQEEASQFFASIGNYDLAKYLIDNVIRIRREKQWRISSSINDTIHTSWYSTSKADFDKQFVRTEALKAEESIFTNLQEYVVLITHINQQKHIVNFVTEDH